MLGITTNRLLGTCRKRIIWMTNTNFDTGTYTDTEVIGTGQISDYVQLEEQSDNSDDVPFTTAGNYTYNGAEIEVIGGVAKLKGTISNTNDWPYTTSGNYTFDSAKIEVTGGEARLKNLGSSPETWDIPYTVSGNYTYDSNKVQVVDGEAKVKFTEAIEAWYHLNESSGTNVPDSSGNGNDGTTQNMDDSNWEAGKLNNCLDFTRIEGEYVNCGDMGDFERTDTFAGDMWVYKSQTTMITPVFNKMNPSYTGWLFGLSGLYVYAQLRHGSSYIAVTSTSSITLNTWTHIAFSYDGSGVASGLKFWINGSLAATTVNKDTLGSNTIKNTVDFKLCAGLTGGLEYWEGKVDELVLYNDEIDQAHVTARYNAGSGTESMTYHTDNPTVHKTTGLTEVAGVASWDGFVETATKTGSDEIKYNLSDDDGVTWYYWNGSIWTASDGTYAQATDDSTVNTNIGSFPTASAKINVKAFLHSNDGSTTPELDNIEVSYTTDESYNTENPTIVTNNNWVFHGLLSAFTETATKPGSDEIKYAISDDDGVTYDYWTGSAWALSDGTYAKSSTASDISSNLATWISGGTMKVKAFLHSNDGSTRPLLDNIYAADQISYPTGSYEISMNTDIQPTNNYAYISTTETVTKPANTDLKYQYSINAGSSYSGSWLTEPELETVLQGLSPVGDGTDTMRFKFQLTTSDVLVTPEIDNLNVVSETGHAISGTFESAIKNSGYRNLDWEFVDIDVTIPSGCSIEIVGRASNNSNDMGSYGSALTDDTDPDLMGKYLQWKATFVGTGILTPKLNSVGFNYSTDYIADLGP